MKKKIFLSVSAILLVIIAFIAYKVFGPSVSAKGDEPQYLYVKTGSGFDDLKNELLSNKYISSTAWFGRVSQLLKFNVIKPGRYRMTDGMSMFKLVRTLRSGSQEPIKFVITKLRLKEDFSRKVGRQFECDSARFSAFINSNDSLKEFGVDTTTVMSLALPLSYSINWNTAPRKIMQRMHTAWKEFWTNERKEKADQLGLSPLEISILASIVDEETNITADKINIASVYINRLKKSMPLQACPTIKYAMRNFALTRIYNVYLQTVSPYNTYIHTGLPPGPICTPQPATIDLVLNVPETDYLYFVASSKLDGSTIFTSDYDEHMKYARLYQSVLDSMPAKQNGK